MSGNEIPVQLDLEAGLVVGQQTERKTTAAIKEEFDEFYDNRIEEQDTNHTIEGALVDQYNVRAIKAELDGLAGANDAPREEFDAYCMDYYEQPEEHEPKESTLKQPPEDTKTNDPTKQSTLKSNRSVHRPAKTIIGPPPTLLRQTIEVVAANLEKYHPFSLSIFSDCQWESIVECRCEKFNKIESSMHKRNKLLMPPISQKVLSLIEQHPANAHLSFSPKIDTLVWKKIVDYSYPRGGITRPAVLNEPYQILVHRLKEWGETLVGLFDSPKKDEINTHHIQVIDRRKSCDECVDRRRAGNNHLNDEYDNASNNVNMSTQNSGTIQLEDPSHNKTHALLELLDSIKCSPMDVHLLSVTGVGKCVSKVVKISRKLWAQVQKNKISEDEISEALKDYPCFWTDNYRLYLRGKSNSYTELASAFLPTTQDEQYKTVTLLEVLQQMLQEWKSMASDNGVAISSAISNEGPPSKKQKIDSIKSPKSSLEDEEVKYPFATFGKPCNIDNDQHRADMNLLHSSTNWRALYHSLQKREQMIREVHGEKVRAVRENLEKNRAKIGKITLKKAVGRVRGSGPNSPTRTHGSAGMYSFPRRGKEHREAILNKSLGMRAQAAHASSSSCNISPRSTRKLSQLRQESKVQAKWSKGTKSAVSKISHSSNVSISGFGAAVARAGGSAKSSPTKSKKVGNQARINLPGGKHLVLPANSSAKVLGMFTSIQKGGAAKKSVGR